MLVRAKWSVKDESGWHNAGDVFQTEKDLGDAVEMLEKPVKAAPARPVEEEPVKAEEAPKRASTRRKKA